MAIDPRRLKPSELCRLLNSTPLGEVTSERQIYRHRQRAGNRIGDGKTVDLIRYTAWLHMVRHAPRTEPEGDRPDQHRMFAEQVTAEYFVRTEGRGRTVDEWKARPEQPDNHWLDCLVGSAVAASMQGALLFGTDRPTAPKRERVSFRELQRRKRG